MGHLKQYNKRQDKRQHLRRYTDNNDLTGLTYVDPSKHAIVNGVLTKKPVTTGFLSPVSVGKMPVFPLFGIISSLFMIVNVEPHILIMGCVLILTGFLIYYIKQSR